MPRQDLLKLLHSPVVVEIVEVVECDLIERIVGTEGKRVGSGLRLRRRGDCLQGKQRKSTGTRWRIWCGRKAKDFQSTVRVR